MEGLTIAIAPASERAIFDNLLQLYVHDFSELFAGTPRGDVGDDGRYLVDIPVGDWWQKVDHVPLLFRWHGKLAGFALLNATTHSGTPAECNIAEFFVLRKYRRMGIGAAAAQALFSGHPGHWEAAVMRGNTGARRFWEAAICGHPAMAHIDIADSTEFCWDGTIFRFEIAPA